MKRALVNHPHFLAAAFARFRPKPSRAKAGLRCRRRGWPELQFGPERIDVLRTRATSLGLSNLSARAIDPWQAAAAQAKPHPWNKCSLWSPFWAGFRYPDQRF